MLKWLMIGVLTSVSFSVTAQHTFVVGDTLPVFIAETHLKQTYTLDTVLERPMLLVVWASWNEPSMSILEEINQQYAFVNPTRRGVFYHNIDVVDIAMDLRENMYQVTLKREEWPWNTHLLANKGWETDLILTLKVNRIPTVFLVDKHRKILAIDPEVKQIRSLLTPFRSLTGLSN